MRLLTSCSADLDFGSAAYLILHRRHKTRFFSLVHLSASSLDCNTVHPPRPFASTPSPLLLILQSFPYHKPIEAGRASAHARLASSCRSDFASPYTSVAMPFTREVPKNNNLEDIY